MFSVFESVFSKKLFTGLRRSGGHEFEHPRTMLLLVTSMQLRIVRSFGLDDLEHDLEQPLSQASQGASVRHPVASFLAVIGLSPSAGSPETVSPEMHGVPQEFVTTPADLSFADLARLKRHRSRSRKAL